ncbi:hypothetical protein ACIB24_10925 [Spongisporangium articulatum]|uniref:Uncharacterized protein n=1 Tax=Spongisporangium articulatum TaxID=3362603 RepID=A0ABW8AMG4_9ACTN
MSEGPDYSDYSDYSDDAALLAELAAALAETTDVPPGFARSGRDLFTFRTLDAELAELVEEAAGALVRSTSGADEGPRTLTFRARDLLIDVDLDVHPPALRGQLSSERGELPVEVVAEAVGAEPLPVPVDDVGYFAVAPFPFASGRFRLRCGGVVTPWIG